MKVTGCPVLVVAGVTVIVIDARCNGGAMPFAFRSTSNGTEDALDVMLSVPVRTPSAAGVKVKVTVQLAPTARELPQVLFCANSAVVVIVGKVSAVAPVLISSMEVVAGALPLVDTPKFSEAADRLSGFGVSVANSETARQALASVNSIHDYVVTNRK